MSDTESEILVRRVAFTASSLDNAPESIKQTTRGRFGARAEGTTLVLTWDNVPSGNEIYDPRMVRAVGYGMICDGDVLEGLLDDGALIRFEATTNTGRKLEPVEIENCP